jgi:hypothetical protein
MFGTQGLRRILGHKKRESFRKISQGCNEIHNLYSSFHIIKVNKSRGITWEGHATNMYHVRDSSPV